MKTLLAVLLVIAMVFCFTACGDSEEYELTMDGWAYESATGSIIPEEVKEAYSKAVAEMDGVVYEPLAYLGSQVVAGTNYALLCKGTTMTETPETGMYIVTVYSGLEGEAEILSAEKFDFVNVSGKQADAEGDEMLAGGWAVTREEAEVSSEATAEFDAKAVEYTKCKLEALAYMGTTKTDAEYKAYVARGIKDGDLDKIFVVITRNTESNLELKSVSSFEIGDYVNY